MKHIQLPEFIKKAPSIFVAAGLLISLSGCFNGDSSSGSVNSGQLYQVTVSGDSNEIFSPSSVQNVASGATQGFTVSANLGYLMSQVVGGTCPQGTWDGTSYSTGAISSNCSVTFSATVSSYLVSQNVTPQILTSAGNLPLTGNAVALQMFRTGNSLFLTGTPFGFAQIDISIPEQPNLIFAASNNPAEFNGANFKWNPEDFGKGALTVLGTLVYSSGTYGMSVIDISDPTQSAVVQQYEGAGYIYQGLAADAASSLPLLYGFSEQTDVYTLTTNGSNVQVINQVPYSSQGIDCCVLGATFFGGMIFVAGQNSLWWASLGTVGELANSSALATFNAVNVATSDNFLYVQVNGNGGSTAPPSGIYVFNKSGVLASFLPISPVNFSVSADDSHLFANTNNQSITVFRFNPPN